MEWTKNKRMANNYDGMAPGTQMMTTTYIYPSATLLIKQICTEVETVWHLSNVLVED